MRGPARTAPAPEVEGAAPVLVHEGAEARLYRGRWLGREALFKVRVRKAYRHPGLDERLRRSRNRVEARLLVLAEQYGVRVPTLYQVLPGVHVLVEEWIKGQTWRELLNRSHPPDRPAGSHQRLANSLVRDAEAVARMARQVARQVARAHGAGLTHGDLTSSNIMVDLEASAELAGPVLVDWGLGGQEATLEQLGSDLQVFWECIGASHPGAAPTVLEAFTRGYLETWDRGAEVLKRREAIERRGRYR